MAEFLRFFALHEAVEEIKPQKQDTGTLGKRQLHDFWIEFFERTVWCELKSFCTNYCGAPGKNITNRIDGILEAMARVQNRCIKLDALPVVIALVYPFRDSEVEKREWQKHIEKLASGPLRYQDEQRIGFRTQHERYGRLITWTSAEGLATFSPSVELQQPLSG